MSEPMTKNELFILENAVGECFDTREKAAAEIRRLRSELELKSGELGSMDALVTQLRAELDAATAKADRLADALQIGREYAAEAVAANKRNYGERLVSRQQLDIDYLAKIDAALADHDASTRGTAAKE